MESKTKRPHGEIHIFKERCKGCGFCVEFCPKDVLEFSEEFNLKGYHFPYVKTPEACTYCRLCEMLCPEFAIFVTLKEEALAKENHFKNTRRQAYQDRTK
ncbi:MAG: 4Fe-4S binding protein [Candidatus Edwardsbacteria bacterium]